MDYSLGNTPAPQLDDSEIAIILELLGGGKAHESTVSLEFVSTKIQETRSLKSTLECATWLEDDELLARLALVERLYDYTHGNINIVHRIVTNTDLSPSTVNDVARYIGRLGLAEPTTSDVDDLASIDALKRNLFKSEPTALLCGLIEAGVISVASGLQEHILAVLGHGVEMGFNTRKQPLKVLLENGDAIKSIPSQLQSDVIESVSAIVRLHSLVENPAHVQVLLSQGYSSAHAIAQILKSEFQQSVENSGLDTAEAALIWTRANATCVRNQGIWIEKLKEKHEIRFTGALLSSKKSSGMEPATTKLVNVPDLFPDLDQIADCPECSSITSPAAYFVDLLHQLNKRHADPSKTSSPTLLDELFKRRPDLGDLKLSCANTKVLVPYIDLANEALESVAASGSGMVKDTYNADDDGDEYDDYLNDGPSTMAENTNFDVYRKLVQPLVFPLTTFPYNEAVESVRAGLEGLSSSRNELLAIFQAPYRLVPKTMSSKATVLAMAQSVLDRAASAEYLGLVGEDYVAITHEAFQSREYLDAVNNVRSPTSVQSYQSTIGVTTAAQYWGYPNDTSLLSDTAGLTCVRDQFLPRSGLTFEETLTILKTGYLGRRLAITSTTSGKPDFSGLVADMRLRHFPPGQKANTPLQASECDDLQAFIRLWRKLGWDLEDLDAAVVMLAGTRTTGIDPIIIDGLAEIKRISSMCNVPIGDILPFWGDMDTTWAKSVYARLFLQRRVTREDPVFTADANGKYLASSNLLISDHRKTIMSTLLLSDLELNTILEDAKWIGDKLTMKSISYIYRTSLFSRMIGISPVQYRKVLSLLPPGSDVFLTPRFTRSTLEEFQRLKQVGWTLDKELFVVGSVMDATGVPSGFSADTAILATLDIIRGNVSAASQNDTQLGPSVSPSPQKYTQEQVAKVSAALFGEKVGSEVERLIQGTHKTTSHVSLQAYVEIPHRLRDKVQLSKDYTTGRWCVSMTGFLARNEKQELAEIIGSEQCDDLHSRSMSLYSRVLSLVISEEHRDVFEDDSVEAASSSWAERGEQLESQTLRRTVAFLKDATPVLSQRISHKAVLKTLGSVIPALDIVVLETLLCDVIRVPDNERSTGSITAMQALCRLAATDPEQDSFAGYFLPPGTDSYTFAANSDKAPNMILNGLKVEFNRTTGNDWLSRKAQRLAGDVWYSLQLSGCPIASFSYTADKGSPSVTLSSALTDEKSVQVVSDILVKLFRAAIPISIYKLQREEVHYFQGIERFDFGALRFANIKLLHAYADLRDTLPKPKGKDAISPLMDLYKTLSSWDPSKSLAKQLELATRWSVEDIRAVLAAKYPSLDETQVVGIFKDISRNISALCELRDIMGFFSKCRLQGASPELLFSLSQPSLPGKPGRVDTPSKSPTPTTPPPRPPPRVCTCRNCNCGYICPAPYGMPCRRQPFGAGAESVHPQELTNRLESLDQLSTVVSGQGDVTTDSFGKTLEQSYEDAAALRLALCTRRDNSKQAFATAENKLRASRRTALVQYLLQQEPIKKCGISDADSLCGYLLIDVMTGPSMRTSRLKQAISTVQTFMERCILGLEQHNGISNTAIDREDYEYLVRYRLWEANRKLFLYPESWIDPTLRDDKSEQFQALEAAISQGKPTEDSVSQAVSEYIYSMHNLGNLEIQAYLWDRYDPTGKKSRLHFFARTIAAPWQFYYRTLDLMGDKGKQVAFWKPWEKMSVDIQVHQVSDDAFNKFYNSGCYIVPAMLGGRLFVFLPHFTSSTLRDPMDASMKDKTPRTLADEKVSDSTKRKQWQMSMGWTEYRKGKWTKKQVSSDVLLIDGEVNDEVSTVAKMIARFPGIETFKFWVSQRSIQESATNIAEDVIGIKIERCVGPLISGTPILNGRYSEFWAHKLGIFEWRDERLVFIKPDSNQPTWEWDATVPTSFMKLSWSVDAHDTATVPLNDLVNPLIARPKTPSEDTTYSFVMSFNTVGVGRASGLVIDMRTDNRTQCVFGYPPADANGYSYDWELGCFSNTVSPLLVHAAGGTKDDIYKLLSRMPSQLRTDGFGERKRKIPHELANPYSLYTWEVAVHAISLLMEMFMSSHQYELALTVARLLFDPAAVGADSDVTKCWKFIPFQDPDIDAWNPLDPNAGDEGKVDLDEYNRNKADVHAAARGRPVAYMKRIVFKYIETLIALGDQLFQQNTLETIPLAIQRYLEASHLFGPPALPVPPMGKRGLLSYKKLVTQAGFAGLDDYSNTLGQLS
ncbi:hypothetical protein O1611_g3199 [Lasiodiplodia mahajangana]|uniref:Uncharacterized protein n=1 Tax=Lasiodiplodia mahajangana TaxID=1108764 RepID=A0ACC2JSG4_9PEZI|nr:hypothetical protein O1611_g3199 [Lasiodiplodia mahajangana]